MLLSPLWVGDGAHHRGAVAWPCGLDRLQWVLGHTGSVVVRGRALRCGSYMPLARRRGRCNFTIEVQRVDFDPTGGELRLSGTVIDEVEGIRKCYS